MKHLQIGIIDFVWTMKRFFGVLNLVIIIIEVLGYLNTSHGRGPGLYLNQFFSFLELSVTDFHNIEYC